MSNGKMKYSRKFQGSKTETEDSWVYNCPRMLDVLIITKKLKDEHIYFEENFTTRTVTVPKSLI